jgi:putative Holliday junction resolvase
MGRILAIDIGKKRTGIAVTDPLRIAANGLDTVSTHELIPFLEKYISSEPVDIIVLGLPTQMDGSESESMVFIRPVAQKIQQKFPQIELVYVDERFTSVLAHQAMLHGGLKKKARQNKALVDKISATIILQSYMESNIEF